VISVNALPISICPHAMPNGLPSSDRHFVSPVIACLVTVYGVEPGRGACAEIDPLLMIRPPCGVLLPHLPERRPCAKHCAREIHIEHSLPVFQRHLVDRLRPRPATRIIEQRIQPPEFLYRTGKHRFNLLGLRHIARDRHPAAGNLHGLLQRLAPPADNRDAPARFHERYSSRAANAAAAAGDKDGFHAPPRRLPNTARLFAQCRYAQVANVRN
jgi:hypothetical protein